MNSPSANIMVAAFDQTVCVKVIGMATFASGTDLKKLVDELWLRGARRFVFDLSECQMVDSTILGVLSFFGREFAAKAGSSGPSIELLNPNPRIAEVLENLGVAHLFLIRCDCAPLKQEFQPLQHEETPRQDVTRTCLEAHNTLIQINPDNAIKFKDVTRFLAEDLKRQQEG